MLCRAPRHGRRTLGRSTKGTSSTGRASVSKTEGWGFKSLVPCTIPASPSAPSSTQHMTRGEWRVGQQRGPRYRDDKSGDAHKRTSIPTFYRQVVAELRKVVYPTQEQLVTYFFVVMVFVIVMMALVSAARPGLRQARLRDLHRRRQHLSPAWPVRDRRTARQRPNSKAMEPHVSEQYRRSRPSRTDEPPTSRSVERDDVVEATEGAAEGTAPVAVDTDDDPVDVDADGRAGRGGRRGRGRASPTTPPPRPPTPLVDEVEADEADAEEEPEASPRTRSRRSAASCGPSRATGSWCTPTPAWRTG